ncbi:MAG: IS66 family transposase [Actinomycetota bacterium]|nr:IS66 family transposase [Actinomycetota bacterium]
MIAGLRRWRTRARRLVEEKSRLADENAAWRTSALANEKRTNTLEHRVVELKAELDAANEKIATLAKLCFGTKSEKRRTTTGAEGEGAGAAAAGHSAEPSAPGDERRRRGQRPGSAGHGRRDYAELEEEEVVHDLDEDERVCPVCGIPYEAFGDESSTQIDWRVRIVRVVHRRRRYRRGCRCGSKGIIAVPPVAKPIPKGLFSTQFLARLLHEKYVLGRPLERIVATLATDGLAVSKGSLTGALRKVSELLAPLDQAIRDRNATAGHLHIDETSWRVFEDVEGKANHRWWLWVFVAPDTVVFHIDPTRSAKVLEDHLGVDISSGALEAGRRLLISADFYTAYQSIAGVEGVETLWCFAHIRRYFVRAGDAHSELHAWRDAWLERFAALYRAHHEWAGTEEGTAGRAIAEERFVFALSEIDVVRQKEAADGGLHPAARKVLATLAHEWEGLTRHGVYPEAALDNNVSERALRGPVVGRKNYYGSGAIWAATLSGRAWTITATAKRAGLNPLVYLHAYLVACAEAGGRAPTGRALGRFFPWQATRADLSSWRGPGP